MVLDLLAEVCLAALSIGRQLRRLLPILPLLVVFLKSHYGSYIFGQIAVLVIFRFSDFSSITFCHVGQFYSKFQI